MQAHPPLADYQRHWEATKVVAPGRLNVCGNYEEPHYNTNNKFCQKCWELWGKDMPECMKCGSGNFVAIS
jgi:hypothetical protein